MVYGLKLFYKDEVRRVTANTFVLDSYVALCEKVLELFPSLAGKTFTLTWHDEENDIITVSSDAELAQAIACLAYPEGPIKLHVVSTDENDSSSATESNGQLHPNVVCDVCNNSVKGSRYKCLQCKDYDLCHSCNSQNKHPGHDMLKLASPSFDDHKWIFPGFKRLWMSMFGHPAFGGRRCKRERPHSAGGYAGKGDFPKFDPATFKDSPEYLKNIGISIANLLDAFGVDVKVDVCQDDDNAASQDPKKSKDNNAKEKDAPQTPEKMAEASSSRGSAERTAVPEDEKEKKDARHEKKSEQANNNNESKNTGAEKPSANSSPEPPPVKMAREIFLETVFPSFQSRGARPKSSPPTNENIFSDDDDDDYAMSYEEAGRVLKDQAFKAAKNVSKFFQDLPDDWAVINPTFADDSNTTTPKRPDNGQAAPDSASSDSTKTENEKTSSDNTAAEPEKVDNEQTVPDSGTTEPEKVPAESHDARDEARNPDLTSAQHEAENQTTQHEADNQASHHEAGNQASHHEAGNQASHHEAGNQVPEERAKEQEPPLDPALANSLNVMMDMGFKNEGGWLLRLLKAKNGSVDAALSALYP